MKKTITGAILCMALLGGVIVNGQVPPPGPGGPPPPPASGALAPGPGGTGAPAATLQPVAAFQGRVSRLSANDDYVYDGFYLKTTQDSMLVKFPAHLGAEITSVVKVGSTVIVNGTLESPPFGSKEVRMVSLSIKGQTIYDSPPAALATPPAENFVNGNGKVVGTQMDREGRMNGLLLDNRTVLRIPPGTAGQLAGMAKDGSQVDYSGMQKATQAGEVAMGDMKIVHCNTISINGQQFLVR
jgi:hypothetical protein